MLGKSHNKYEKLDLKFGNCHGLITGAGGAGKTATLQVLAEGFSRAGVPVFATDIKGDLSGIAAPGERSDALVRRAQALGLEYTHSSAVRADRGAEQRGAKLGHREEPIRGKYDRASEVQSAYEVLQNRVKERAAVEAAPEPTSDPEIPQSGGRTLGVIGTARGVGRKSCTEVVVKQVARSVASRMGRKNRSGADPRHSRQPGWQTVEK